MSSSVRVNTSKVFLLVLFVLAVFIGALVWLIRHTADERQSYGRPLIGHVEKVLKKHENCNFIGAQCTSYKEASVAVTIKGEGWTYGPMRLKGNVKNGQHLRVWLYRGNSNDAFIEQTTLEDGDAEFGVLPYRGWITTLFRALAITAIALALALVVLRERKKSREPEKAKAETNTPVHEMFREMKTPFKGAIHFMNVAGIIGLLFATDAIKHILHYYGAITLVDLGYALAGLVVVVSMFLGLMKLVPWLSWSWTNVLNDSDDSMGGSDSGGPKGGSRGLQGGENFTVSTVRLKWIGPLYGTVLVFCLPLLAHFEEQWFRGGTHGWGEGLWRSFAFGMVHCLVGVPLAAGLAIGVFGLWLTQIYFWGGVHQTTEVHTAYNAIIFGVAGVALLAHWLQMGATARQKKLALEQE
jgi:hypothetical protein